MVELGYICLLEQQRSVYQQGLSLSQLLHDSLQLNDEAENLEERWLYGKLQRRTLLFD